MLLLSTHSIVLDIFLYADLLVGVTYMPQVSSYLEFCLLLYS
jgi:hypothetical protein